MAYPQQFGYCVLADVTTLFTSSDLYTGLTDTRVNQSIADAAVEMDAILNRFYVTPIVAPANDFAYLLCAQINKYLAASLIHKHFFVGANPEGAAHGSVWHDYAYGFLDQIVPPRSLTPPYFQPIPVIRFTNATLQANSEIPAFPEGAGITMNTDDDPSINPDKGPYFQRTDRIPKQGGFI